MNFVTQTQGVYKCPFLTEDGSTLQGLVTHFEPIDARHAFPW